MPPTKNKPGQNLTRWAMLRENGERAMLSFMREMDERVSTIATELTNRFIVSVSETWESILNKTYARIKSQLEDMPAKAEQEMQEQVRERINFLPHLKGEPGYTPVKDKDYFDGKPGEPGVTPVPDVDYPTLETVRRLIGESHVSLYDAMKKEGLTPEQIKTSIAELFKNIDGNAMARALEQLTGKERLDYLALKNRPGEPVADNRQRTLHRGGGASGGKETYEYDLSDQCNGVLKSFTIPANTRIVLVQCTDAPAGFFRKTVDYTGTGTTTLTLAAGVAAPQTGASLSILYVV